VRTIFADTLYWIAIINPRDQWHTRALAVSKTLAHVQIATTDEVLIETLNFFAERGESLRYSAMLMSRAILQNTNVEVIAQSHETFLSGIELYEERPDKGYSLTDCISMSAMRERGITDALTHDHHFAQEGFTLLL